MADERGDLLRAVAVFLLFEAALAVTLRFLLPGGDSGDSGFAVAFGMASVVCAVVLAGGVLAYVGISGTAGHARFTAGLLTIHLVILAFAGLCFWDPVRVIERLLSAFPASRWWLAMLGLLAGLYLVLVDRLARELHDADGRDRASVYVGLTCAAWAVAVIAVALTVDLSAASGLRLYRIDHLSMAPALKPGDWLVAERWSVRAARPRRFDVVVLTDPDDPDAPPLVKRVVGLPGETVAIEGTDLFINGERYVKSDDEWRRVRVPLAWWRGPPGDAGSPLKPREGKPLDEALLGDRRFLFRSAREMLVLPDDGCRDPWGGLALIRDFSLSVTLACPKEAHLSGAILLLARAADSAQIGLAARIEDGALRGLFAAADGAIDPSAPPRRLNAGPAGDAGEADAPPAISLRPPPLVTASDIVFSDLGRDLVLDISSVDGRLTFRATPMKGKPVVLEATLPLGSFAGLAEIMLLFPSPAADTAFAPTAVECYRDLHYFDAPANLYGSGWLTPAGSYFVLGDFSGRTLGGERSRDSRDWGGGDGGRREIAPCVPGANLRGRALAVLWPSSRRTPLH
ncbi:MAG: signal peptidase I [Planctomycetes bacterium]|nr:signal peptidase I [Planctomycetota bacterium]